MVAGTYSFENICVDTARMVVTRDGVGIPLEPKTLDVLLYLLDHRDRLVTKDELLETIWKDTFVTPNALTRAIAQLRKALGDDAHEARIIGTVAKRGYRFIAPVIETTAQTPAGDLAAQQPQAPSAAPTVAAAPARAWSGSAVMLIAIAVLGGIGAVVWMSRGSRAAPAPALSDISVTRFTTRQGFDAYPAVSPDGRSLVYASDRTGSLELYQTGTTAGSPDVALTSNGGRNTQPEWSPDGKWIAFRSLRFGGIWIVASAGGAPQRIVDAGSDPSWSPDSERIVFVTEGISTATPSQLLTVRRDGTDRQVINFATPLVGALAHPAWSHNGRWIAFSLNHGSALRDVWLTSPDGRTMRKLAAGLMGSDIRWAPADDRLFWGGLNAERFSRIMYVSLNPDTGEPAGAPEGRIPIDGGWMTGLSLTRDGEAFFGIIRSDSNLWQLELRGNAVGEPTRLTNDTVRTTYPRLSGDGRLAFIQFIEGRDTTAWIMEADGRRTPLVSSDSMQGPQWSHDGRRMFVLLDGRAAWIDLATRTQTPILVKFENPSGVQLAPNEAGILNHRGGADRVMNVWLSPFDGSAARQMTFDSQGASYGAYSPDGKWIGVQLTRGSDTWLGVMPSQPGATISPLVKERGQSWLYSWSPDSARMAFAGERDGVWNVFDVERATGVIRQLTHWTNREGFVRYPAWSPRGDRIVFERAIPTSSLWTAKLW